MTTITATGTRKGKFLVVVISRLKKGAEISILFNGKQDRVMASALEDAILTAPNMANCYTPPRGSLLSYYNALENSFFDIVERVNVKGRIETIPKRKPKDGEFIFY